MSRKTSYASDVVLGKRYQDTQTGIVGYAVALSFYQHSCERVVLEAVIEGKIEEYSFDVARVRDVETERQATTDRTGGPGDPARRLGHARR